MSAAASRRRLLAAGAVLAIAGGAGVVTVLSPAADPGPPADRPLPPLPRGAAPLRIVLLGTSLTARPGWPDRLPDALSACLPAVPEVVRMAEPGAGSAWGLAQAGRAAALRPDLVLIEFAVNDADLLDGVSLATAAAQHRALAAALRAGAPDVALGLMTMSPAEGPRGWARPRLAAHYAQYRSLAAGLGAGLLDLYPRWMARPPAARGMAADGLHPDSEVAAAVVLTALVPWVAAAAGAICPVP